MDGEEVRVLTEIRERLVRVETKIDAMTDVRATAQHADKTADEALQSARSAHHRVDRIDRIVFWLGTTFVGGFIVAIVAFTIKGGFAR